MNILTLHVDFQNKRILKIILSLVLYIDGIFTEDIERSVGTIVIASSNLFGAYYFASYLTSKGSVEHEAAGESMNQHIVIFMQVLLWEERGLLSAEGTQTSMPLLQPCTTASIQNLLNFKEAGGEFAQLNPSGQGELANVNLLKAGYHIGIDTIGQSLRNANQQIRSEPANPQLYVGPWNNTTIEPDFMRPPLEIGAGASQ